MFVPLDAYDLLKEDPVAFEYFYMQVSMLYSPLLLRCLFLKIMQPCESQLILNMEYQHVPEHKFITCSDNYHAFLYY
jgi:hypothetical protein